MKALLQVRDDIPEGGVSGQENRTDHRQLTRLLDEPERKLLLKMADLEDALREEACLNSFISGYRLAQGIQQELLADQPPYNFENEDEQRACELTGKER